MRASKVPPKEPRRVVIAASVANIIEWYDFYIFGSLAAILAVKFFEKGHAVAAFLSTVAIFSVGFLIRPLGAFVFGWLGDKVGRKYTFIVTLTGMGLATALIRSEEHTSELQSQSNLVCRLLLEKKKNLNLARVTPSQLLAPLRFVHHLPAHFVEFVLTPRDVLNRIQQPLGRVALALYIPAHCLY